MDPRKERYLLFPVKVEEKKKKNNNKRNNILVYTVYTNAPVAYFGMAKQRKEPSFLERNVPFAKGRFFYERKIFVGPR